MTDSLPAIEKTSPTKETGKPEASSRPIRFALLFASGCFALALAVALAQNLRKPVLELAMLFDSGAYVMSVKYVLTALHNFKNGMAFDAAVKSVAETLMLNGPVLPGLGALFFSIIGKEPSLIDMRAPVVLQAIIHACASALLALAGWRFSGGRVIGLSAGIILAIWPPAIIGASRFLTETMTTLFISLLVLSASLIPQSRRNLQLYLSPLAAFIFGGTAAVLVLVKAALAPGTLLTIAAVSLVVLLAKVERRSLMVSAVTAAFGFCLFFAPWLMFTKIATGDFSLTSRRMPTFNIAAGLNPETDGYSALPETPLVKLFSEADGPAAVAYALYNINPGDFYGRMMRKPLRLSQFPWNDCRVDFLGLPPCLQIIVHQLLMVFGFFGLLTFASIPLCSQVNNPADSGTDGGVNLASAEPEKLSTILIGIASLSIIGGHLAYLPFVADSRYGFTATPCLILFATWCFASQYKQSIAKAAAIRLFIAASFIMLAFTLKEEIWRSLFSTSSEAIYASSLTLGALLLFIGCLMAVRTLLGTGRTNAAAKVLTLTVSYLSLTLVLAASLCGKENPYDWEARLSPNEELCRVVKLPHFSSPPANALVLANLKGDWRAARLRINGQDVNSSPISLLHLTGNPALSNDYRTFSWILHTDTSGLDQWRAFVISPKLLKPENNVISLKRSEDFEEPEHQRGAVSLTGSTTGGDNPKDRNSCTATAPSWNIFSPTKLFSNPLSFEPRLREKLPKPVGNGVNFRKRDGKIDKDLSGTFGIQRGQYHMFLLLSRDEKAPAENATSQTHPIYIDAQPAPHLVRSKPGKSSSDGIFVGTAAIAANAFTAPHLRLKLTGEVECSAVPEVKICLNDLRLLDAPVELACYPSKIEGKGKRGFALEAITRADLVDPKSACAMIKISSDLVPLSISNLRLEIEPLTAPELTISGKRWF